MYIARGRHPFTLSADDIAGLSRIASSRTESAGRVQRARMLLDYHAGYAIVTIASEYKVMRTVVRRTIDKAVGFGCFAALDDLPRSGRPRRITDDARLWLVSLACQKPKELGYPHELWSLSLLAEHARTHCATAGHPSLLTLVESTVHKILAADRLKPHKVEYYLERRDPDFDAKMEQVLCVYREVNLWQSTSTPPEIAAVISCDEKPGIQAIANTAPDLPPVPETDGRGSVGRDYEYKRHGTVSLIAGIDLQTGSVHGIVRDRHRTREFIEFLKVLDERYPKGKKIRLVLDNHSAHISKELQKYLATVPNRFEFVFTPKHGSWLNLIEVFFSKLTRSLLRGIRVGSKSELVRRIERYLDFVNERPAVFRWKYKMEDTIVV